MPSDLAELLRQTAAEPTEPLDAGALLGRARRQRRRAQFVAAAVVTCILAAGTAGVVATEPLDVAFEPTSPDVGGTVTVVPPGSVTAEWVNGQPVWVVHDETGDVTVFDAVNPHSRFGVDELVGWCESSGWFEAGGDGSRFDGQGRYAFGPAPHGLVPYDVVPVDDRIVRVGERQTPTARRQGYDDPAGPHCAYALDQTEHPVARYHPVEGSGRRLFDGVVVPGDDGHARFCPAADVVDTRCPDDALVVPEVTSFPDAGVLRNSILAREEEGVLRDVIYLPEGYEDVEGTRPDVTTGVSPLVDDSDAREVPPPPAEGEPTKGIVASVVRDPSPEGTVVTLADGADVRLADGAVIARARHDVFVSVPLRDVQVGDRVMVWADVTLYRKPPIHLANYMLVETPGP